MKQSSNGQAKVSPAVSVRNKAATPEISGQGTARAPISAVASRSVVAKVSHTLTVTLAERLEEFAFFQRISESAVIEHALNSFFAQSYDDTALGDILRLDGAGRRRKS